MDYTGPDQHDLDDVHALNTAVLETVRAAPASGALTARLSDHCRRALVALSCAEIRRLASAPFLLVSIREADAAFWTAMFDDEATGDLFAVRDSRVEPYAGLLAATVGFAWQLARRNPYTARLVCGASAGWCRRMRRCRCRILWAPCAARLPASRLLPSWAAP